MTGQPVDGAEDDRGVLVPEPAGPVQFETVVRGLAEAGYGAFIETCPHPVLTVRGAEILTQASLPGLVCGTLRRDAGGPARLLTAAATAFAAGRRWPGHAVAGRPAGWTCPRYPFQRQRYWLPPAAGGGDLAGAGLDDGGGHPLLGAAWSWPAEQGLVAPAGWPRRPTPGWPTM